MLSWEQREHKIDRQKAAAIKNQVATLSASDKNKTEIGFEVVKAKLGFSKNPGATAIALSA